MAEPIKWGKGRKERLLDWLTVELNQALSDRKALESKWMKWLTDYRAPADQPTKHFPYEGASNIVLPVIATDVDILYSNELTTIHEPQNLWTLSAKNERWVKAAKPVQDFLQFLDHSILKMYQVNKRVFLEKTKLGTGIYKHGWHFEKRRINTYDAQGERVRVARIKSVPFVDHVRCFDFIMPSYAYHVQPDMQGGAPWVAERRRIATDVLLAMAETTDPALPNISKADLDRIMAYECAGQSEYDQKIRSLDYEKRGNLQAASTFETSSDLSVPTVGSTGGTAYPREVEFFEIHARYATEGDTFDDIVVWFHLPTRTAFRAIYLQYDHGHRPYEVCRYFPGEGFWGIGVCEQKEIFQKSQSDLWNYQTDNVLLANATMMAVTEDSGIVPGESIWPGKMFRLQVDDVRKGIMPMKMSDINQTLPQLHEMIRTYGERRVGVSDLQMGDLSSLPGRTPATSLLAAQGEGKKRPDLTLKDMRYEGLSPVGLRVLQLCQQYMRRPDLNGGHLMELAMDSLGEPEGSEFAQKLMVPTENAELGLGVLLTATSAVANKEVEKQNMMGLMQITAGLAPQYVQLVQMAMQAQQMGPAGAPLLDVCLKSVTGIAQLHTRLLEQHDIRNAETMVPAVSQTPSGTGLAGQPGGAPAPLDGGPLGILAGAGVPSSVEGLLAGLGGSV